MRTLKRGSARRQGTPCTGQPSPAPPRARECPRGPVAPRRDGRTRKIARRIDTPAPFPTDVPFSARHALGMGPASGRTDTGRMTSRPLTDALRRHAPTANARTADRKTFASPGTASRIFCPARRIPPPGFAPNPPRIRTDTRQNAPPRSRPVHFSAPQKSAQSAAFGGATIQPAKFLQRSRQTPVDISAAAP